MNQKTTIFSVQDIRTEGCMMLIHDEVEEHEGVLAAEINLRDTSVSVTFDADKISEDQIREIIRGTGYRCAGHEHTVILRERINSM